MSAEVQLQFRSAALACDLWPILFFSWFAGGGLSLIKGPRLALAWLWHEVTTMYLYARGLGQQRMAAGSGRCAGSLGKSLSYQKSLGERDVRA